MVFTSKTACKLVRERARYGFSRSVFDVLTRMVASTRRKTEVPDVTALTLKVKIETLMVWAGLRSVRQAERVLALLVDAGIVTVVERKNGLITYKLDVNPISEMDSADDLKKEKIAKVKQDRATKARTVYAANRAKQRALLVQQLFQVFCSVMFPHSVQSSNH